MWRRVLGVNTPAGQDGACRCGGRGLTLGVYTGAPPSQRFRPCVCVRVCSVLRPLQHHLRCLSLTKGVLQVSAAPEHTCPDQQSRAQLQEAGRLRPLLGELSRPWNQPPPPSRVLLLHGSSAAGVGGLDPEQRRLAGDAVGHVLVQSPG